MNTRRIPPLMRIPVPWVYILAYLIGVALQHIRPIVIHSRIVLSIGLALIVAGVVLAFSALGIFKRKRTTTVPFETPATLVMHGPYRFSRNPMYVGLALVYVGVAAARLDVWPLVVLPLLLFYVNGTVIPVEERRLHEVFGDTYDAYRARVRRWV